MKIGEKIRLYRKEKGLTQLALSAKANISRSYLADVENNRYNPSIDVVQSIAKALGVPVEEFFKEDNISNMKISSAEDEFINSLTEENRLLFKKIKSLSKDDARKILDIIKIFEQENEQ